LLTFFGSCGLRSSRRSPRREPSCAARSPRAFCLVCLALGLAGTAIACSARGNAGAARPGRPCGSDQAGNLLTPRWQQCWFTAAGGRWRTLKHDLHYDSLVVNVEAVSLEDAREIAERFIENQPRYKYLSLYVYQAPASTPGPVRRLEWARSSGFSTLDFNLAPAPVRTAQDR
jgi:hypothetical protein